MGGGGRVLVLYDPFQSGVTTYKKESWGLDKRNQRAVQGRGKHVLKGTMCGPYDGSLHGCTHNALKHKQLLRMTLCTSELQLLWYNLA